MPAIVDHRKNTLAEQMFPTPWRVDIQPGTNRARIVDYGEGQVLGGMNVLKAQTIVAAMNRDSLLLPVVLNNLKLIMTRLGELNRDDEQGVRLVLRNTISKIEKATNVPA